MFKWGRTKDKYEPKTPHMPSVSLPDERYTPIESHIAYSEKPRATSFLRRFTQDYRGTTPMLDAWAPHPHPVDLGRSRSRTVSTPVRDVQAPRPIRPHPSQGGFMEPTGRIRDSSRGPLVPVGVPSAAFLEEQIRRGRIDTRTTPPSNIPIDMSRPEGLMSNAEEKRLKAIAKRTGATVYSHPSKAYLDELNEQQKRQNLSRNPSAQPTKKKPSEWVKGKELLDFEDWKSVPLELDDYHTGPKYVDPHAPLKPALKKTSSLKPVPPKPSMKSVFKKESSPESKAYYSENESSRRRYSNDRMKPTRVIDTASKAFLEEQQEKLERIKQRGWASHPPPRQVPETRPNTFGHNNNSSSTSSPTESVTAPAYDQYGRLIRPRRSSFVEPASAPASNYIPPYIKGAPTFGQQRLIYGPTETSYHGILSWPMVEYATRKHLPFPLVYFDAGFNPRDKKFPVKASRDIYSSALTREEMDIPVVHNLHLPEMWIINKELHLWPIHLKNTDEMQALRVIDVFRAIYDTFAQPLTPKELAQFGEEYIRRCQPAFQRRCEDSSQFTHIEEMRGLLRIDLLRGHRIFKGLVPMKGRPFQYELLFDDGR